MSSTLISKHCVPPEDDAAPMDQAEIAEMLGRLTVSWDVMENKKIRRTFQFADFIQAMEFVNRVADIANAEGHHPDIAVHYNRVTLEIWTHTVGGLSENDFILAAKIEQL